MSTRIIGATSYLNASRSRHVSIFVLSAIVASLTAVSAYAMDNDAKRRIDTREPAPRDGKAIVELRRPAQETLSNRWFGIFFNDHKCGYAHTVVERHGDRVITTESVAIELLRETATVAIRTDSEVVETIDGQVLSFKQREDAAGMKTTREGVVRDGMVDMTITVGGQSATHRFGWPRGALMTWGGKLLADRMGYREGTTYRMKTFDPSLGPGQTINGEVTVGPLKTLRIAGINVTGISTTMSIDKPLPMKAHAIVDDKGDPLAMEVPLGAFKIMMVAMDRKRAEQKEQLQDMMTATVVPVDRPIPPTAFRLTWPADGSVQLNVPDTAFQHVVSRERDGVVVALLPITAMYDPMLVKPTKIMPMKYLSDSPMVNLRDPALKEMAVQATRGMQSSHEKALALARFVRNTITEKDLSQAFASAGMVAKTRRGDCTEHAVLLASLGRICGIPTRAVTGLAYMPTPPNGSYWYHMWTQMWLDGVWIDLDGTLGSYAPTQSHIALAINDLNDEQSLSSSFAIITVMGQLRITPMGSMAWTAPLKDKAEQRRTR